jgi:hypothetical protein
MTSALIGSPWRLKTHGESGHCSSRSFPGGYTATYSFAFDGANRPGVGGHAGHVESREDESGLVPGWTSLGDVDLCRLRPPR